MTKSLPRDAERRLLDFPHLAAYLSVSLRAANELGRPGGEIPRVTIGHRVLFDRADVDAFIEATKKKAS